MGEAAAGVMAAEGGRAASPPTGTTRAVPVRPCRFAPSAEPGLATDPGGGEGTGGGLGAAAAGVTAVVTVGGGAGAPSPAGTALAFPMRSCRFEPSVEPKLGSEARGAASSDAQHPISTGRGGSLPSG